MTLPGPAEAGVRGTVVVGITARFYGEVAERPKAQSWKL